MVKLAKVTLRHKKTGRIVKINAFEYASDINGFAGTHELVTYSRGDEAPDDIIDKAVRDSALNEKWLRDPKEQKKRGDHKRAQEFRKVSVPIVTNKVAEDKTVELSPQIGDADYPWQASPWFSRRKHVEMITGRRPRNAADAERLMADHS